MGYQWEKEKRTSSSQPLTVTAQQASHTNSSSVTNVSKRAVPSLPKYVPITAHVPCTWR